MRLDFKQRDTAGDLQELAFQQNVGCAAAHAHMAAESDPRALAAGSALRPAKELGNRADQLSCLTLDLVMARPMPSKSSKMEKPYQRVYST